MNHEDGTLLTDDGLDLYWQSWQPPGRIDGVLFFLHGLGEHSGRYGNPVRHFVARGWTCFAIDLRGHGKSPGLRVHVDSFDDYLADMAEGHRLARIRYPEAKLFIVGHSQGGLLTLLYAESNPDHLDGIVVSSPFLGVHPDSKPSALLTGAAKIASKITPKMLFSTDLDPSLLSRDPAVAAAYIDDPLVSTHVSARWATAATDAQSKALAEAPLITTPALVMQAGADRLADPEATRAFVSSTPADLIEYIEWPGYAHELFNEPLLERRQVFDTMERWLEQL